MFGKPTLAAVGLLLVACTFVAVMFALGAKDIAALGGLVGMLVAAAAKTQGEQ